MKRSLFWIVLALSAARLLPHVGLMWMPEFKAAIRDDLMRWAEVLSLNPSRSRWNRILLFVRLMTFNPEFRNLFYMRIGGSSKLIRWLCPPMESLYISRGDIGGGLFIQHGIGTVIAAEHIGKNCWINQGVTVGFTNEHDRPTIGDNVKIHAGAKIVGRITVGNNAVIGLNTVVIANVPSHATVFGIPGQVVWTDRSKRASESLVKS